MNKIKSLFTLVKLENSLTQTESASKNKHKRLITTFIFIMALIYIVSIGYSVSKELIKSLTEIGAEKYFTTIIIFAMFAFSIMISVITSSIQIIKDKTNILLNTYPISSRKRFLANFLSHLFKAYSLILAIGLVSLIYFGIAKGSGFEYYLMLVIGLIFIPILSTMVIYSIMFMLNGIIKLFVNKKFLKWVGFISSFVFMIIYVYVWNGMFSSDETLKNVLEIVKQAEVNPLFWYPKQITNIILGENRWQSLLGLVGINLISFILMYLTIGKIYLKELLRIASIGDGIGIINFIKSKRKQEDKTKEVDVKETKESKKKNIEKGKEILESLKFKKRNLKHVYLRNEFKFFTKDPSVAANTILVPLILPIFMTLAIVASFNARLDNIRNTSNMYFIKEQNLVLENKEEAEALQSTGGFEDNVIEEVEGLYVLTKYTIASGTDIKDSVKAYKEGLENKNKEKEVEDKSFIDVQKSLKDITIIKEFDINVLENDNTTLEQYFEDNKELFDGNEKAIEGILFDLDYYKQTYNAKNVFEFLWFNRNLLKDKIGAGLDKYLVFMIPVLLSAVVHFFSTISLYMISKDKNERQFFRSIPISNLMQFNLKRLPGIIVKVSVLFVYLFFAELILNTGLYKTLFFWLGVAFSLLLIVLNETFELYLDSRKPHFNWKTPLYLVKQSLRPFLSMIIKMVVIASLIAIYILVFHKQDIGLNIFVYTLVGLILLTLIILEGIIYKNRHKLLNKM